MCVYIYIRTHICHMDIHTPHVGGPRVLDSFQQTNCFPGSSAHGRDHAAVGVYTASNGMVFLYLNSSDQKFSFKPQH